MKWWVLFLEILYLAVGVHAQAPQGNFQSMPALNAIQFFENKGQWPSEVLFKGEKEGGKLWVMKNKLIFHQQDLSAMAHAHERGEKQKNQNIREHVVHAAFVNSLPFNTLEKSGATSFYHNYFLGKDSTAWAAEVHGYDRVVRHQLYPGIDLTLNATGLNQEYGFVVSPGADPTQIRMQYAGHSKLSVDRKGNLVIESPLGQIKQEQLAAFQEINGQRIWVDCKFIVQGDEVVFRLGSYNKSVPLVIDPVLVFATYNGAFSDNFGMTATYGQSGAAYSAGMVYGNNFPMPNGSSYDPTGNFVAIGGNYGVTDVFITKYNPTGTAMLWATFLGGGDMVQGTETANSLICDSVDNIYIFGATSSIDFPTTNGAFQATHAGGVANANFLFNGVYFLNQGTDLFVSKLSANGQNLLASTYVGGTGNDGVNYKVASLPYNGAFLYDSLTTNYGDQFRGEIMLDQAGNVLIASCTRSTNFPTVNAFQATNAGAQDGVIFRLSPSFNALQFSSYYGGSQNDAC